MTDLLAKLPPDPLLERRRVVQLMSQKTQRARSLRSSLFLSLLVSALMVAIIPLFFVCAALVQRGDS